MLHQTINGLRYHNTPIGLLPGVTTILSSTKDAYSQRALDAWKQRVGKEEAQNILDRACKRGNAVHSGIESILLGKDCVVPPLVTPLLPILDNVTDAIYIEQPMYHPVGFGGSPDLVCKYKGIPYVLDWKTSTKPKKRSYVQDYILQVCAYIAACNWLNGTAIERGLIAIAVENTKESQIFEISPKQFAAGWSKFQDRLVSFQAKYSSELF